MKSMLHSGIRVCIKGGGEMASGVAWRLFKCGFRVCITEIIAPMAVRRGVSFCEAVHNGTALVQGVEAVLVHAPQEINAVWDRDKIPLLVDPRCDLRRVIRPEVIVDAILAKKNLGTSIADGPLVIALGPGFEAGKDAHAVVETQRGHDLGRLLTVGRATSNTGVPGSIEGYTKERVLRSPAAGPWESPMAIGDHVTSDAVIGSVVGIELRATIDGVLRGMIRPGTVVGKGLKIGDIDPRNKREYCFSISEKALAIAGGVLEGILRAFAGRLEGEGVHPWF